jgi:hypothetical protein
MAQTVYSVNTVGYVNLAIPANYSIIANPLVGSTNTIPALFPGVPVGTTIYKFVNGVYQINPLRPGALGWADKTMTLVPGEGVFIFNPGAAFTNTFVGEVTSGNLTNAIPAGFSIVSSMVPQAGRLTTDLGYVTGTGSQSVYLFDSASQSYSIKSTLPSGAWIGGEPTINVGQGFFISVPTARNWTRTFTTGG